MKLCTPTFPGLHHSTFCFYESDCFAHLTSLDFNSHHFSMPETMSLISSRLYHSTGFPVCLRLNNIAVCTHFSFCVSMGLSAASTSWLLWTASGTMQICHWNPALNSSGYIPRNGMAGSYGCSILHLKKWNRYCASHSGCIIVISTLSSSNLSMFFLPTLVILCTFDSSYSSVYYFGLFFMNYILRQSKGVVCYTRGPWA